MSVCEKSMHVVANIFTLPTLSFAQKTLGNSTTRKTKKNLSGCEASQKGPVMYELQEPQRQASSKYLKPVKSNDHGLTTEVIQIEKVKDHRDVNELAQVFIEKTRRKLLRHT
uniref:Uncharacterized protein n=1 Tax=Cajanus cajan TaxID=3821 RepID=A0A151RWT6_CAJCA|nr:hypothetical protein KK1_031384 [Cajanus cajan]